MTGHSPKTIQDLIAVMAALRTPVTGCPWDLEQTFETIAPYTVEEAYEVADAIARGDRAHLCEELGDLLLQVVYHAQLGAEEKAFDFADVVDGITTKMIRRHPHVFGDDAARSAGAAKGFWEKIKAEEKAGKPVKPASILEDVPLPLPALTRAIKLQDKAAAVGFDWPNLGSVLIKMSEELGELEQAVLSGDAAHTAEEFGDLLFVMANVARHMKIDPEEALRQANRKFTRRFQRIEALLAAQGKTPAQSNLNEMDKLWDQAKAEEAPHP
ncbi:MAG: nucleoside triphosphate pyrophosphohydrolase [Hyphomicrobiaceae bacterium]